MKTEIWDAWYVAGWIDTFEPGTIHARKILDKPLAMFRTTTGSLVALDDRCSHRGAPLSMGQCEGDHIRCMYHGLRFDPLGVCTEIPGQDMIPSRAKVRTYPVIERHGWAWVWMGDATRADDTLIPPAIGIDDPEWRMGRSEVNFDAAADLLVDNLLDFSHLSYVHRNSFKADPQWAFKRPTVTLLDRGVRVQRWLPAAPALASARDLGGQIVDTWSSYELHAPGILIMRTTFCKPGTADLSDGGAPVEGILRENQTSQAITPVSDSQTEYYFCFGSRAHDATAEDADRMVAIAKSAFEEDRLMIESQQRILGLAEDFQVMPTTADKAIVLYDRIRKRLAKGTEADENTDSAEAADRPVVAAGRAP